MTTFDDISIQANQFWLSWIPPKFYPLLYKQTTSCTLLCDERTYYLTEKIINSLQSSSITKNLNPGSVCLIKLIAEYNPASTDPGIGLSAHTLYTSNCEV